MRSAGLMAIKDALRQAGGDVRVVGGAVRDGLLGRPVEDIDCATTLAPLALIDALRQAGIAFAPTGLAHGTVTAIVDRKGYEITTLRRDVRSIDGRHAEVVYTDDWQEDAARRDFTFNAMSLLDDGAVADFFGGFEDLKVRRVRFIGDPEARIREDSLRILRAFRFASFLSLSDGAAFIDEKGLAACADLAPLMANLSVERVWKETGALLRAPNPAPSIRLMVENGVMPHVLKEGASVLCLERMLKAEALFGLQEGRGARRLAALLNGDRTLCEGVAGRLRLSSHERDALVGIAILSDALSSKPDSAVLRNFFYDHGKERVADACCLSFALGRLTDLSFLEGPMQAWAVPPVFPLRGADLLERGVPSGIAMGKTLRDVEVWWRANDFAPDRRACLERALESIVIKTKE